MKQMKAGRIIAATLLFALLLTGCGQAAVTEAVPQEPEAAEAVHEHTWADATCTEPKKCTECGETEGEPLGHDWTEATCEAPKTCSRCGATEGEPLEHDWAFATPDAPKTCKKCGATEGEAVSVRTIDLKGITGNSWKIVEPIRESIICEKYDNDPGRITVNLYDYEGNLINEIHNDVPYYQFSYGFSIPHLYEEPMKVGFMIAVKGDEEETGTIDVYSPLGEKLATWTVPWTLSKDGDYLTMTATADSRYLAFILAANGEAVYYLDMEQMELLDASLLDVPRRKAPEYDKSKYGSCSKLECNGMEGYLIASPDKSQWGYADSDMNEIAMYEDATGFTLNGFAMVSEKDHSYDIIDADHNVVAKDYTTGNGAYLVGGTYGTLIAVVKDDGQEEVLLITGGK